MIPRPRPKGDLQDGKKPRSMSKRRRYYSESDVDSIKQHPHNPVLGTMSPLLERRYNEDDELIPSTVNESSPDEHSGRNKRSYISSNTGVNTEHGYLEKNVPKVIFGKNSLAWPNSQVEGGRTPKSSVSCPFHSLLHNTDHAYYQVPHVTSGRNYTKTLLRTNLSIHSDSDWDNVTTTTSSDNKTYIANLDDHTSAKRIPSTVEEVTPEKESMSIKRIRRHSISSPFKDTNIKSIFGKSPPGTQQTKTDSFFSNDPMIASNTSCCLGSRVPEKTAVKKVLFGRSLSVPICTSPHVIDSIPSLCSDNPMEPVMPVTLDSQFSSFSTTLQTNPDDPNSAWCEHHTPQNVLDNSSLVSQGVDLASSYDVWSESTSASFDFKEAGSTSDIIPGDIYQQILNPIIEGESVDKKANISSDNQQEQILESECSESYKYDLFSNDMFDVLNLTWDDEFDDKFLLEDTNVDLESYLEAENPNDLDMDPLSQELPISPTSPIPTMVEDASFFKIDEKPKKFRKSKGHLWKFLLELLSSSEYNPNVISWVHDANGIFQFEDRDKITALWTESREKPTMPYDFMARAIRYYYKKEVIIPYKLPKRRMVFQFGPGAHGWKELASAYAANP